MSAPVRFLAVAVFGWVTVRAAAQALWVQPLPPIPLPLPETPLLDAVASESQTVAGAGRALPPNAVAAYDYAVPPYPAAYVPTYGARPYPVPIYVPVPAAPASSYPAALPRGRRSAPDWLDEARQGPNFSGMPNPGEAPAPKLAMVDGGGLPRPRALPSPARKADRAAASRPAKPVRMGAGAAAHRGGDRSPRSRHCSGQPGQRWAAGGQPGRGTPDLPGQPCTGRQPQGVGPDEPQDAEENSGRNAFALLAEGGVYDRSLPWSLRLNGYGQAGVVSLRDRAWFVDGGATLSRPLSGRFALGAGAWGGAQQGLARLELGPRISMQLFPGVRTHLDYRHRLKGKALPGSGYAVTVGADF